MRGRRPPLLPLGEVFTLPGSKARIPPPPDHLDAGGQKIWKEAAAILVNQNIYDDDCEHLLGAFCVMYSRFLEADAKMKNLDLGSDAAVRWRVISNQSFDRATRVAAELGLTPFARKRVMRNRGTGRGILSRSNNDKAG